MPELPEVEVIRRELKPLIRGRIFAPPRLEDPRAVAYPTPELFISGLPGRRVKDLGRRGKYLLLELDRGFLVVHLRMTGNLLFRAKDQSDEERFLRLVLPFRDGAALFFSDMRRFGRIWLVEDEQELESRVLSRTGPDLYGGLDETGFLERLARREGSRLKALLLDQSFAAGLGNIYTDECLHRCGIHPRRRVETLSETQRRSLFEAIGEVLSEGITHGGTTFRDYRTARGALGDFQSRLAVYGRGGELCTCGTPVVKTVVAGRGTYYCPCCQGDESEEAGKGRKEK